MKLPQKTELFHNPWDPLQIGILVEEKSSDQSHCHLSGHRIVHCATCEEFLRHDLEMTIDNTLQQRLSEEGD